MASSEQCGSARAIGHSPQRQRGYCVLHLSELMGMYADQAMVECVESSGNQDGVMYAIVELEQLERHGRDQQVCIAADPR